MRDKFDRAIIFVARHQATVGYLAGVAVGSVLTYHSLKNRRVIAEVLMQETPEQIAELLKRDGVINIFSDKGSKIIIRSGIDPLKMG